MPAATPPAARQETNEFGWPLYAPGRVVPPGRYLRDDRRWSRPLVLQQSGVLPASLDGHGVRYARLPDATD